ncbi:nucleoside triphosphate pyrophosphatase [Shouchella sp. JSM 1781072]|uniref:Maf family protein n=1 Tax=Bacillaceae TaxID=186817 RepID=UPI000C069CD2|nr:MULTISPECIES: Maf family protein [Bacillaceae]UTR05095.1 Maf family protein [Alkalihalobacillus sp. LMS6]
MNPSLLLASSSPRRSELLKQCRIPFTVFSSDVDETLHEHQTVEEAVCTLAKRKAEAVANQFPQHVVLAADTIVSLNGEHLGKPKSKQEAKHMLQALSHSTHAVSTGVAIISQDHSVHFSETTSVTMTTIDESFLERYLQTDEWIDKAGAYGIQSLGALFVSEIKGDYYTVVGLPLVKTIQALSAFHIYPNIPS